MGAGIGINGGVHDGVVTVSRKHIEQSLYPFR